MWRYLPGAAFLAYLTATVLLFFYGPWRYPVENARPLITFLVAVHAALLAGYLLGIRATPRASPVSRVTRVALICVLCELALLFPTSALNTGSWLPHPLQALSNLGGAYLHSLEIRERSVPWVNYARILAAPALASVIPLCLFYWTRLPRLTRWLFVASIAGSVSLSIAMGISAGPAHFLMLLPWFIVAAHLSGERRLNVRRSLWLAGIGMAAALVFVALFARAMNDRLGSFAVLGHLPGIDATLEGYQPPQDGAPAAGPPRTELRVAADGLAGYFSHGYYAVYLSLREPFVPMYGIGHSVFLQRQVARIRGDSDVLAQPYPVRIEARGWNAYGYWATIYPWIASDVGFPGTVAVVFMIGVVFGAVWVDVLEARNPWAVVFLGQILTLLYYMPAHNKTMHSGEGLVAFSVLLTGWLISRVRSRRAGLTA